MIPQGLCLGELGTAMSQRRHRNRMSLPAEMPEDVERTNLAPCDGGIRRAMTEQQDLHAGASLYPRYRAMGGPTMRVTGTGSRRQTSMRRPYFALVGLRFGSSRAFTR